MLLLSQQFIHRHTLRSQRTHSGSLWRNINTKSIDDRTRHIFTKQDCSAKELNNHLIKNVLAMNSTNISNIIYLSSKKGVKLNAHQLTLLSKQLQRKDMKLNKISVAKILYGFRTQSDKPEHMKKILKVLTQKISGDSYMLLDGQGVGNSLYGLQNMTGESTELRALLSELRHHVKHCTRELKSQEIGNALYGLHNMSSDIKEVRDILHSLADRVLKCPEELSAQTVGNSVYSLQHMDSEHVEVRKLLDSLRKKIDLSKDILRSQRMSCEHIEVRKMLKALCAKVGQCKYEFTSQEIGSALYGLQGMSSTRVEVQNVLKVFSMKIKRLKHPLDSHALGMILYGLQGMSSGKLAVRELLVAVLDNITRFESEHGTLALTGLQIGSAMYGMQGMDAADVEVRDVLMYLHQQLVHCKEDISAQTLGNIIFGLQDKTCDHKVVRDIVQAASARVHQLSEPITIVSFGSALSGLRCMSSDVIEVREMLTALCTKLTPIEAIDTDEIRSGGDTADTLTRSICNALYGLQCMDSEHSEVRRVLAMLSARLDLCPPSSLTAQHFGNAMYGMQLMTCRRDEGEGQSEAEFEGLLRVLCDKARTHPDVFMDVRAIGNSFYGLISAMKYPSEARAQKLLTSVVGFLLQAADGVVRRSVVSSTTAQKNFDCSNTSTDDSKDIIKVGDRQDLWRSLVLFSHFTDSSAALTPDLRSQLARLCAELSLHAPHSTLHITSKEEKDGIDLAAVKEAKSITSIEKQVQEQVDLLLQHNPTVQITHNEMLYGFESDIVLRVSNMDSGSSQELGQVPAIIRNVEIDGITHLQPRRRKFSNLRDIYLEDKYNIKVSRIRFPDRQHLSDEALKEVVLKHLEALKLFVITQQTQHTFF